MSLEVRGMTTREIEWLELRLIMAGAVGQNAKMCEGCGAVEHFPNTAIFQNCLFTFKTCGNCKATEPT